MESSEIVISPKVCKIKHKIFSFLPNMMRHCLGKTHLQISRRAMKRQKCVLRKMIEEPEKASDIFFQKTQTSFSHLLLSHECVFFFLDFEKIHLMKGFGTTVIVW